MVGEEIAGIIIRLVNILVDYDGVRDRFADNISSKYLRSDGFRDPDAFV